MSRAIDKPDPTISIVALRCAERDRPAKREPGEGLPSRRRAESGAAPATVSGEPSQRCHWFFAEAKAGKAEKGDDPQARRPA
jgi:hypothetical protein